MAITKAKFKKTVGELLEQVKSLREELPNLKLGEVMEATDDLRDELNEMSEKQQEKYGEAIDKVDEVAGLLELLDSAFSDIDTAIEYLESAQEELENA